MSEREDREAVRLGDLDHTRKEMATHGSSRGQSESDEAQERGSERHGSKSEGTDTLRCGLWKSRECEGEVKKRGEREGKRDAFYTRPSLSV